MKFSATLALAVIVGLVASSSAFPAQKKMIYYQRPAQYLAAPQRMMYVQYMHTSPFARSTQGAEAVVAGETVATGSFLQDYEHAEADINAAGPAVAFEAAAPVDVVADQGEEILSEAAAYPVAEESVNTFEIPADVDIVAEENEVSDDAAKQPRDLNLDGEADEAVVPEEAAEVPEVAAEAPVELEQSADSVEDTGLVAASEEVVAEEEAEEEEEEEYVAPVVTRRPARRHYAAKKPAKAAAPSKKEQKPLPVGTFFPINFGDNNGATIAVANSFSTGEGGSATSHAIAYGSPKKQ